MKKTVQIIIARMIIAVIIGLISLFISWVFALNIIPVAEAQRGFSGAVGGEWILIIASFVCSYIIILKAFYEWLKG